MTEGKNNYPNTLETGFWAPPIGIVCSSGRGIEIAANLQVGLDEFFGRTFKNVIAISPEIELTDGQELLLDDILTNQSDASIIAEWLHTTTEGRPGQVMYSGSMKINQLGTDLVKIAGGKLRVAAIDLIHCHELGIPYVDRLYWARDTGYCEKIAGRDLYHYKSHPGGIQEQRKQALEQINADWGLLMTATTLLGGRFPTRTKYEIYQALSFLFSLANLADLEPDQIARDSKFQIVREIEYTTFKVRPQGSGRFWPSDHCLKDVPGGLDFSNREVGNSIHVYMRNDRVVHPLPTDETFESVATGGQWHFIRAGEIWNAGEYSPFVNVRKGMLTTDRTRKALYLMKEAIMS